MARIDLESGSPAEIYEAIAEMDGDEFDELMEEPASREKVISALVDHMASLFRPEKAGDLEARIHIKLWDKPGGGYDHFELRIEDGTCELAEPTDDPDLTLKVRPSDLRKLVTGETGAKRLAFKGRLRAIGDLGLGMKLPDLFAF
jgi:putative sterol carrier protein